MQSRSLCPEEQTAELKRERYYEEGVLIQRNIGVIVLYRLQSLGSAYKLLARATKEEKRLTDEGKILVKNKRHWFWLERNPLYCARAEARDLFSEPDCPSCGSNYQIDEHGCCAYCGASYQADPKQWRLLDFL